MLAEREGHVRIRRHIPWERRQLGNIVSGVLLNPLLGGPTATTKQPTQTTTEGGRQPQPTTPPPPALNHTVDPPNNGGSGTSTVFSGSGSGGGFVVAVVVSGTSSLGSPTGSASNPSSSSNGNSAGNASPSVSTNRDPSSGFSGSGSISGSDSGPGSSDPSFKGLSYSISGSSTGVGSSPSDIRTLGDDKGNKPHGRTVAAAVILTLLFSISVVIFILRRRSKAHRADQGNKWWFACKRTSHSYGDDEALCTGHSSRRSSFATTVDQSHVSFLANATIPPPPPPMAEVGRSNGTAPTLVLDIHVDQNRFSISSAGSCGSQFLIVHHRESLSFEPTTSARTESFPFPKPPVVDRTSLYSKTSRTESKQDGDISPVASAFSPSLTLNPMSTLFDLFPDNNPFQDHHSAPVLGQHLTGTVRRPFFPQLQDELQVSMGDTVRILQGFDDGWALAEKIGTSSDKQGFLPLECFLLD